MFRPAGLGHFVPAFVQAADAAVARWRAAGSRTVQRIDDDMTRTTFAVISSTLLPSTDESLGRMVQHHTDRLQRHAGWDILYASLKVPRWLPRPGAREKGEAIEALRGWVMRVLEARKSGRLPGQDDLLQRLIDARDPESGTAMDDEQLVDNLLTFYLAGHETTAKALTWTLYLLAREPEWQQRLREEIEQVTGGAPLAAEHLERLVLTEQVVKEAIRLYPPAPMMGRQSIAEGELGGHRIVPGMNIQIPIYVVHRHAARWERPDAFEPERFGPEREKDIPRYQYMPFGAGPRVCIGMSFALMEAKVILAALVRSARFETVDGPEPLPVARVTLVPKGGMPLRVVV
jgi:cytochrome P450